MKIITPILLVLLALAPLSQAHYHLGAHKAELTAEESALFDHPGAFQEGQKAIWSPEHMALFSFSRYISEKAGGPLDKLPLQVVQQLSPDGMTLTRYTRYTLNGETRYEKEVVHAVGPFVFMDVLNLVIPREDEVVMFTIWNVDPVSHALRSIIKKDYNFLDPSQVQEYIIWQPADDKAAASRLDESDKKDGAE